MGVRCSIGCGPRLEAPWRPPRRRIGCGWAPTTGWRRRGGAGRPVGPGWWVGEAALDADELRADDRRVFAWRVAPPGQVTASSGAGPFVAAALAVLEQGRRVRRGSDVVIGDRLDGGAAVSVVIPPADPTLIGQLNRALAARGAHWRLGSGGTPGPVAASAVEGIDGIQVTRR